MQHDNKGSDSTACSDAGLNSLKIRVRTALAGTGVEDIRILASLPSSNTALMQAAFASHPQAPILCWALQQTSGRGRRGRHWHSDAQQALTFSIAFEALIHPDAPLSSLSPASGLALARALDRLSPAVRVKWPNDLWRKGRKFTGILLEACTRGQIQRVVIGVGINLYWPEDRELAMPAPHQGAAPLQPPGGLFDSAASEDERVAVLAACVRALTGLWHDQQASEAGLPDFSSWPDYDALAAQEVAIYNDQEMLAEGINAGIAGDGAFLLQTFATSTQPAALRSFGIGEVSLRQRAQPQKSSG